MIRSFFFAVITSFFLFLSVQDQQLFTISPEQPKIGDKISVTYDASTGGALLADSKEITLLCLAYRGEADPLVMESPMTKNGKLWTGTITLTDPKALHLVFQFVSGETYDDNNRDCWTYLIHGKNDKPVQGAYYSLATIQLNGGNYFGENKKPEQAQASISKELELYPDNADATLLNIRLKINEELSPESLKSFRATLGSLQKKFEGNEQKIFKLCGVYALMGDTEKAKEIEQSVIAKSPKGYMAQQNYLRPYSSQKNTDSAAALIANALTMFPDMEQKRKQSFTENIAYRYANERQFEKASEWLKKIPKPDGTFFNYVARMIIENSGNLETAATLAREAITLNRAIHPTAKPSYTRESEWKDESTTKLAASLGTLGNALMRLDRFQEAETILKESHELYKGKNPDVNQRYVWALRMNKNYSAAIEIGKQSVRDLQDNAKLLDDLRQAYTGRDGSDDKFSEILAIKKQVFADAIEKAGKEHAPEIEKKIKEGRTSSPAPDFTLNNLNGVPVTLSSLKGKVVIVDFWATWCGPCKQSFPYLQYVYELYEKNDDVKILAVNTWERIKGKEAIIENAKKFMQVNNYTFPVLFDENAVTDYGVEGIPTKFILDKNGNIAFTSVGFEGPQMVEEMKQAIELLLKENSQN